MDPEKELLNKLKKDKMRQWQIQRSLECERKAIATRDPELKEKYNQMASKHSQKARLLRELR